VSPSSSISDLTRSDRITFCLVAPEGPGNIGSAARAMKNMGFTRLALVSPTDPRREESIRMAYRSREVLDAARLFPDLSSALSESEWVVGLSGRKQKGGGIASIETLAPEIWERAGVQRITLLFGSEGTGLSNEALSRCHRVAFIPTGSQHTSLNLAQAVLLVAATLLRASASSASNANGPSPRRIASVSEIEAFFQEMESTLENIGFLKPKGNKTAARTLRNLFMRAEPDSAEIRLLRAMFRQIGRTAGRENSFTEQEVEP